MIDDGLHVYDGTKYIGSTFCDPQYRPPNAARRLSCIGEAARLNDQALTNAFTSSHPAAVMLAAALDHLSLDELRAFDAQVGTRWTAA